MLYCQDPDSDEPIFLIDAQIGRDDENPGARYVDGAEFLRELLYMDGEGKKRIQVWINSPGGKVTEGMAIYGGILNTKTKVDTFCYGVAYSIAGVIFQAGRKRKMMDYATLMYHDAYVPGEEPNKGLQAINDAITTMISSRSWKDEEAVKRMMKQTSFISANDALESGLCDEVQMSDELNIPRAKSSTEAEARWQYANDVLNKILPENKTTPTMNKAQICAMLGLDINTPDDVVTAKLAAINALAKEAEAGRAIVNADKEKLEKEKAEAEAKAKAAQDALDAMNKANEEAKVKAESDKRKSEAKAKILETLNKRGIPATDKVVDNYCNLAGDSEENLKGVIETIEAIPVTKKGPDMSGVKNLNDGQPAFKTDDKGGVMDTAAMAAYMNKKVAQDAVNRFKVD